MPKEGIVKKVLIVLCFLVVVFPLSARSTFEVAPRASLYISSVNFGLGGDIIVNPTKNIGLRVSLAELVFGDNTLFSVNSLGQGLLSNIEVLVYAPVADIISYFDVAFGMLSGGGTTSLTIGGGAGYETSLGRKKKFFVEPGLLIVNTGNNTDVMFRLSGGLKFGVFE